MNVGKRKEKAGNSSLAFALMAITSVCVAQSPPGDAASAGTRPVQAAVTQTAPDDQAPLTDRERALLDRIRNLEARLSTVESKVSAAPSPASDVPPAVSVAAGSEQQASPAPTPQSRSTGQPSKYEEWKKASSPETWGGLDPGNGFQVVRTNMGSLNISGYGLIH